MLMPGPNGMNAEPDLTHFENTPIQIYWKFYHQKMKIFR